MVFAGLVVSAVAVLLAIFTKLPQAGGGLTNNLMVMRYYLSSAPQLPPTPPPRAIFFLETRKLYKHHPKTFGNTTQGPMPRHHSNPRLAVGSNKPPPTHAYFSIPTFSLPFPSQLFLMMTQTIGKFALMFIALSLPWLAATGMTFLAKDVPATKHARANNLIRQTDRRRFLLPIQRILPKRTCPSHPRSSDSLVYWKAHITARANVEGNSTRVAVPSEIGIKKYISKLHKEFASIDKQSSKMESLIAYSHIDTSRFLTEDVEHLEAPSKDEILLSVLKAPDLSRQFSFC